MRCRTGIRRGPAVPWTVIAALAGFALAMLPVWPAAAANLSAKPPAFGIQFHGTWEMYYTGPGAATPNEMFWRHLDGLKSHGVTVIRVDIGWSASQPRNAPPNADHWYNKRIALVLKEAAARGMKVLLTLHQSPSWARGDRGGDPKQLPDDPESITGWATWMAKTYGPSVMAWEVWNEPNLQGFTGVAEADERARRYAPLLKAAHTGLRAGDSNALVVFGGTAHIDTDFIRTVYQAGAKPYFDIMAVHPYQGNQTKPPGSRDIVDPARITFFPALIELMASYGDETKPVWWTEMGFSVHSNEGIDTSKPWTLGVPTPEISGRYLVESFELARLSYPQVRLAVVYTTYKPPSDPAGHQHGYRLFEQDGSALPQSGMLRDYMNEFSGHAALRLRLGVLH